MPDSYYPDTATQDAATPDAAPSKEPAGEMEGETALLPKSILGGKEFQPGEELVLKIVRDYGDEIEVSYAAEKKPTEPSSMDKADSQLTAMAQ